MGPRTRVRIVKKYRNETKFDFQGPVFILNVGIKIARNTGYVGLK